MRRSVVLALAFSLVMVAAGVWAQQQEQKTPPRPALRTHSGEVVSVDATKNEIVIKQRTGKEMTLAIAPDARITKARKTITLNEIKAGDRVTTRCDESGGKCLLKSIRVQTAAPRTS